MAKRKKPVWGPTMMPALRESLIAECQAYEPMLRNQILAKAGPRISAQAHALSRSDDPDAANAIFLLFDQVDSHLAGTWRDAFVEIKGCVLGRLFWVKKPMVELAVDAEGDMPEDGVVQPPYDYGVMAYERGLPPLDVPTPGVGMRSVVVDGVSWSRQEWEGYQGWQVTIYERADRPGTLPTMAGAKMTDVYTTWIPETEEGWTVFRRHLFDQEPARWRMNRLVQAMWSLMGQENVAQVVDVDARTGHDKERTEKLGLTYREDLGVRLVDVRPLKHVKADRDDASGKTYTHRWMVRGHWRMQAVGPKRGDRRRTWIPSHIKGPEGAPMIQGREDVYVWRH